MMGRLWICVGLLFLGLSTEAGAAEKTRKENATEKFFSNAPARRLEDIHIEGEIPVPQVLFVTARDQRRFMDFHHRRYLKTSLQIGQETVFPSWITLVGNRPDVAGKETTP